MRNVHILFTV